MVAPPHEAAKRGPGPYPENYVELIKYYLKFHLVKPESLRNFMVIKPPEKVTLDTAYPLIPLFRGQQVWECFIVYDAQNEDGKYVGNDMHVVWIRYNRVVAFDYKETELDYRFNERMQNPGY